MIETNIRLYKGGITRGEEYRIRKLRYLIANHFMETYEMQKLPESEEVVGKSKLVSANYCETQLLCNPLMNKPHMLHFCPQTKTMTLNMDPRAEEGSFSDRRKKSSLQPLQLLKVLKEELDSMGVVWPFSDDVKHLEVGSGC